MQTEYDDLQTKSDLRAEDDDHRLSRAHAFDMTTQADRQLDAKLDAFWDKVERWTRAGVSWLKVLILGWLVFRLVFWLAHF